MDYKIMLDLAEDVGSVGMCEAFVIAFSDYKLQEIDEQIYVVGLNPLQGDFWERHKKIDSSEILFDLFKTIKEPLPQYWSGDWLNEIIPAAAIIDWCYKYGLLWDQGIKNSVAEGKKLKFSGFPLHTARRKIAQLYSYFQLWFALVNEDFETAKELAPLTGIFPKDYPTLDQFVRALKEWLPITFNVPLTVSVDFSEDAPRLKALAQNLTDVCMYQLLLLMTRAPMEVKKHLKTCKNPSCGSYFWADHGNQKYCLRCNAKTVWDQTKRGR